MHVQVNKVTLRCSFRGFRKNMYVRQICLLLIKSADSLYQKATFLSILIIGKYFFLLKQLVWSNCTRHSVPGKLLGIFNIPQTSSTMEGASSVFHLHGQVFGRKLAGKNAKEGIFTRFPGFRYRSIAGVRPFDYAQGPHPAATAAPPFQSGLGLISSTLLRNICLRQHKIPTYSYGLGSAYAQGHAFLSGGSFLW